MANVPVSIRLSPQFAAALDRATEYLDLSPSQLVEMLLKRSELYQKELLGAPLEGPFPEKINLRLSPEVMHLLRRLTGYREVRPGEFVYGIEPSVYIRSVMAHFFSKPGAFQAVFPNGPWAENWTSLFEEHEEDIPRRAPITREATPGDPRVALLILVLPLLVLLIIGIADLFKGPTPRQSPPPPPPPPSSPDGEQRLAGDVDHDPEWSSTEGTRS